MPVIPALWKLRQEDCAKFKASLGNIAKNEANQEDIVDSASIKKNKDYENVHLC